MSVKVVNKIVVLFFVILSVIMLGTWQFLHSEKFGKVLSKNINQFLAKKLKNKIDIKKFELKFFPPGIIAKNVEFKINNKQLGELQVFANEIDADFNLFNTEGALLSLNKLDVNDAIVYYSDRNVKRKRKKYKKIDLNYKDLKVEEVNFNNVMLEYNDMSANLAKLKVKKIFNKFQLSGSLEPRKFFINDIESVDVNLILDTDLIDVKLLEVKSPLLKLIAKGRVDNFQEFDKIRYDFDGRAQGQIEKLLKSYNKYLADLNLTRGNIDTSFKVKGWKDKFEISNKTKLSDIISSYAKLDTLKADLIVNNEQIRVRNVEIRAGEGKGKLNEDLVIKFNENLKSLKLNATVENLKTSDALRYINDTLYPLKGELNGDLSIEIADNEAIFITKKGFFVNNFKFAYDNSIIENPKVVLDSNIYAVKGQSFYTKGKYFLDRSLINIEGEISDGNIYFSSLGSKVNLQDLGKIAGLDFRGNGNADLIVDGPFEDVKFKFNLKLDNASFENYYLGKLDGQINIKLKESIVELKDLEGKVGGTTFFLNGDIGFDEFFLKLKISLPHTNYYDISVVHKPIFESLTFMPEKITGNIRLNYDVKAKGDLSSLNIRGRFFSENISFYDETFKKINFDFNYFKDQMSFNDIKIFKKKATIVSNFKINTKTNRFKAELRSRSLKLSDFKNYTKLPGELRSDLNINMDIDTLDPNKEKAKVNIELKNSTAREILLDNSKFTGTLDREKLNVNGYLFGNNIRLASNVNLKENISDFKLNFNIENLKKFFIAFLGINTKGYNANGRLIATIDSKFDVKKPEKLDASIELSDLLIQKDKIFITNHKKIGLEINNGIIKPFDFEIKGRNAYLAGKGGGDLSSKYSTIFNINYDASLIELLHAKFLEVSGEIRNTFVFKNDKERINQLETESSDLTLNFDGLPFEVKKADYKVFISDKKIVVDSFTARLNQGVFNVKGAVDLVLPFPRISINYSFDKAELNPIIKTSLLLTGVGNVLGDKLPYSIVGDFTIDKANIRAELKDFENSGVESDIKNNYFPKISVGKKVNLVRLNTTFHTSSPIFLQNSMAEMGLVGEASVTGDIFTPEVDGRFSIVPGIGKLFFKNNEFIVNKGELVFNSTKSYKNPDFDVTTSSIINDYKIKMRVFGDVDKYDIDLSSEPSLSKNDIFSMIAFGYTEDVSRNLSDADRGSLSSVGIGSILFSRFNITNTLKESFGLQVNLGTEIQENNSNMLGNRGDEGEGEVGRIRSATKIELKKQLMDNINLSLSKTVGGSIGNTQKVNLNYKINDKYSLELVHENRTQDEGVEDITGESVGADFKIRWKRK